MVLVMLNKNVVLNSDSITINTFWLGAPNSNGRVRIKHKASTMAIPTLLPSFLTKGPIKNSIANANSSHVTNIADQIGSAAHVIFEEIHSELNY